MYTRLNMMIHAYNPNIWSVGRLEYQEIKVNFYVLQVAT